MYVYTCILIREHEKRDNFFIVETTLSKASFIDKHNVIFHLYIFFFNQTSTGHIPTFGSPPPEILSGSAHACNECVIIIGERIFYVHVCRGGFVFQLTRGYFLQLFKKMLVIN